MPANKRPGRVFVLRLFPPEQTSLVETDRQEVERKVIPGSSTTRYGREWIIGQTSLEGDVLTGRIGFRGAEGVAEVWDDVQQDFHEVAIPAGLTAPFAIDLTRLRMAIQPRGMKLSGVVGAFQAILSTSDRAWKIRSDRHTSSLAEWRQTVDRITSVRFRVRQPNPHWQDTPDLEEVMTQAEAEVGLIELGSIDGIDVDSEFVAQAQAHVERGYGEAVYKGVREGDSGVHESVFNTAIGAEEESVEVAVNTETGEAAPEALAETLSPPPGMEDTQDNGD